MERAEPPLRPLRQNIFNLPNGTVSQVKAIPIHDTSTRSGCGFWVCVWHVKKRNHSRNFNNSNASFASYVRKKAGNRYLDAMAANRMIYGDNRETHFRRMQTFSTRIIASLARISGKTANFYGSHTHTHAYTRYLMRIIHSILPTLHFLASLKLRWLCVFGNKFDENGKNLNGRGQTFVA